MKIKTKTMKKEKKKTYSVKDCIQAQSLMDPIKCEYCGSLEVVYNQTIIDGKCQDCGAWQLEN